MIITVLLTCFNRKAHTLACLDRLQHQELPPGVRLKYVLMDDNSTDGTAGEVASKFPEVEVLNGNGSLYWCGGMREAWKHGAKADPDYYLLINDDSMIVSGSISVLLELCGSPDSRKIAVGAFCDPDNGVPNYGGVRRKSGLVPVGKPELCDTFNANLVLVPRAVYQEMGILHTGYTHYMGDYDYGFQATFRGIEVWQSPKLLGTCGTNSIKGTYLDRSLSRRQRFKIVKGPKGLPFKEWYEFNRRNHGVLWPVKWAIPYLRITLGL